MKCPNCTSDINETAVSGYRVFSCNKCSGLWVPGAQIKRILREKGMAPSMDSIPVMNEGGGIPNTKKKCPTCQDSTLIAHSVRGTEIDICKTCQSVYFDKNEFEEVFRGQDKSTSTQVAEYTALELVFQAFLALLKSPL